MAAEEFHIEVTNDRSLAPELLSKASGLSINQIKQAMQKGAVWLTDDCGTRRLRRAKKPLPIGSRLHFYYHSEILAQQVEAPLLLVDEDSYSIWIKPRGVLSQGSKWGDHSSITRWVETNDKRQRPAFLVHRLDRAAIGLILIAHGKKATKMLAAMFARRDVQKVYQARVIGRFPQSKELVTYRSEIDGRSAISHARLLKYNPEQNLSDLEVIIETGRKHQIRRHLSEAGFPILGDRLYGGGDQTDLQLAAVSLAFQCPISDIYRNYNVPDSKLLFSVDEREDSII